MSDLGGNLGLGGGTGVIDNGYTGWMDGMYQGGNLNLGGNTSVPMQGDWLQQLMQMFSGLGTGSMAKGPSGSMNPLLMTLLGGLGGAALGGSGNNNNSFTNANPYTSQMLQQLLGMSGSANAGMGNAYGKMGDLVTSSLNNYNPQNFLTQFMQNAGGLGSLAANSQVGQNALMGQAQKVGEQGVQAVANDFAGLGSIYSGGAAQQADTAMINPMMSAMQQGSAQQSSLLNSLYGGAMSGLASGNQAQLSAGLQGAGLYGQQGGQYAGLSGTLADLLGGYGSPLMMANQTGSQSALSGLGSAASGLGALFSGLGGAQGISQLLPLLGLV